jgi:hypothetical protein
MDADKTDKQACYDEIRKLKEEIKAIESRLERVIEALEDERIIAYPIDPPAPQITEDENK